MDLYRIAATSVVLLLCSSLVLAQYVSIVDQNLLSAEPANKPLFSTRYGATHEYHAWHMSNHSILLQVIHRRPKENSTLIADFRPPNSLRHFTAYRMISAVSSPAYEVPIVTWIASSNVEVVKFSCGPTSSCKMLGGPTALPPMPPNFSVQSILDAQYASRPYLLLVHPGGSIKIEVTATLIKVVDALDWTNQAWFKSFPVDRVSGAVHTYKHENHQVRGRLVVSLAPKHNITAVGMVVSAYFDDIGRSVRQVAMMPQAAQNFAAHEREADDGLVYYWPIEQSIAGVSANAFIVSSGGSPDDPLHYAATKFDHGVHWSNNVFLFNDFHFRSSKTNMGLLVSGTGQLPHSPHDDGFHMWTPKFAFGVGSPEVTLGGSTRVAGFGMPILGSNLFSEYRGGYATMAAQSSEGWSSFYLAWILDDYGSEAHQEGSTDRHHLRSRQRLRTAPLTGMTRNHVDSRKEERKGAAKHVQTAATTKTANKFVGEFLSAPGAEQWDSGAINIMHYAANCRVSNCDIDEAGDCPVGKCWARGAIGGFQCCEHPPV